MDIVLPATSGLVIAVENSVSALQLIKCQTIADILVVSKFLAGTGTVYQLVRGLLSVENEVTERLVLRRKRALVRDAKVVFQELVPERVVWLLC